MQMILGIIGICGGITAAGVSLGVSPVVAFLRGQVFGFPCVSCGWFVRLFGVVV